MTSIWSAIAVVTGVASCIVTELEATPQSGGTPGRVVYATPGNIAWDGCDCGQLALSITRDHPTLNFPADSSEQFTGGCNPSVNVTRVIVSLLRCAPGLTKSGGPPTPAALLTAALITEGDRWATRRAIRCCLEDFKRARVIQKYLVGGFNRVGPEGGCVGIEGQFIFEEI